MSWIIYSNRRDSQGHHEFQTIYVSREAAREFLGEHHVFQKNLYPHPFFQARLLLSDGAETTYRIFPYHVESNFLPWSCSIEMRFPSKDDSL